MRIAVCDDDERERQRLVSGLKEELAQCRLSAEVDGFESGAALLTASECNPYEIYFLDIVMPEISGVAAARTIRVKDSQAAIVFITFSREYFADGFAVGAVHYLVKPYAEEDVREALKRCLRQVGEGERYIELTINRENRRIMLSDFYWVESKDKVCLLHLRFGEFRSYIRLDELEAMLGSRRFLRCHRSYIINMDHVVGIEDGFFYTPDGTAIPLRREERAHLRTIYEDYLFEKMRRRQ